jgi:hypothetical protein
VLLLPLLLVALSGCERPAGPATSWQLPTSSSSSAATSTTAPASSTTSAPAPTSTPDLSDPIVAKLPAAARIETEAGAKAFSRFFIQQLGAFYSDTQTVDFTKLYTPACTMCQTIDKAFSTVSKIGKTRRNPASVTYVGADIYNEQTHFMQVTATFAKLTLYRNGKAVAVIGKSYAGNLQYWLDLEYDGHWRVTSLKGGMSAFQD